MTLRYSVLDVERPRVAGRLSLRLPVSASPVEDAKLAEPVSPGGLFALWKAAAGDPEPSDTGGG